MLSVASSSTATPTIVNLIPIMSTMITKLIEKAQSDGLPGRIPHLEKLQALTADMIASGIQVDSLQHKVITGNLETCAMKAISAKTAELLKKYTRLMELSEAPMKDEFAKVVAYLQFASEFNCYRSG